MFFIVILLMCVAVVLSTFLYYCVQLYLVANNGVVRACPPRKKRVKKGPGFYRLRFTSWNVGTLTSKSIELVKALH